MSNENRDVLPMINPAPVILLMLSWNGEPAIPDMTVQPFYFMSECEAAKGEKIKHNKKYHIRYMKYTCKVVNK